MWGGPRRGAGSFREAIIAQWVDLDKRNGSVVDFAPKLCPEEPYLLNHKVVAMLLTLMLLAVGGVVTAQEGGGGDQQPEGQAAPISVYSLGSQTISISAGVLIPLFYQTFQGQVVGTTNLSLGGMGSLQYGLHLDNHWLLGLEVGGSFNHSIRDNFLYMVPISLKGEYIFHLFPFEFPVYLGAGMAILKYRDQAHINLILKPGFSTVWKYNTEWGFGLNLVYWWVPQPWPKDPAKSRMGNFLELSLTAQYNF